MVPVMVGRAPQDTSPTSVGNVPTKIQQQDRVKWG